MSTLDAFTLGAACGWFLCLAMHQLMRISLERRQRHNQAQHGYDRAPKPLPMRSVEAGQRFKVPGGKWPLLIGHENEWTVWTVLDLDELPRPPASQSLEKAHGLKFMAGGAA